MIEPSMHDFRRELRQWLEANCPPRMRTPVGSENDEIWGGTRQVWHDPDAKLWLERMVSRGFTAPTWPREYGGGGLTAAQAQILEEELRRIGARLALRSLGIWLLGPALLEF